MSGENSDQKEKVTLNKTWILVAVLVAVAGGLLIISLTSKNVIPNQTASINESPKSVANTSLKFSDDIIPSSGSAKKIDILINTNGDKITTAQLELLYDPSLLTNVDINPGEFFPNGTVIQKDIDSTTGRISFWIRKNKTQNDAYESGVLASLAFTKIGSAPAQIDFLPKTSVQAAGIDQSVLKNTTPGIITNLMLSPTKTPNRLNSSSSAAPIDSIHPKY